MLAGLTASIARVREWPAETGDARMADPARRAFPGCADQVARARQFVSAELAGCPVADEAVLCVSELATNALMHTSSGEGGKFEVIVQRGPSSARISVRDQGAASAPAARPVDLASESGRGLGLVSVIADRWGQSGDVAGRVVWFELRWEPRRDATCA
jgi:anti-sigma regulatory factor (Ser/Thr protein kinase)